MGLLHTHKRNSHGAIAATECWVTKKTAPRTTGHCCASRNLPCKLPADPRLLDGVAAAAAVFRSALLALQAATRCSGLCALCFAKYVPHALQHLRPALATRQTLVLVVPQLQHICRMDTKDRHTCKPRLTKAWTLLHDSRRLMVLRTLGARTETIH